MNRPIVTILRISLDYARYFDWLVTGLGELHARGEIEYRCELQPVNRLMSLNGPRWLLRRLAPNVFREITGGPVLEGTVKVGDKTTTFCYDIDDRPFWFDLNILHGVDRYFKAQLPARFPDPLRLSDELQFSYPATVLECQDRILPAMLGRPLGRSLRATPNRKVLDEWRKHGEGEPAGSLFAYFGGATPAVEKPLVMDTDAKKLVSVPAEFPEDSAAAQSLPSKARFGHPNQKRVELVRMLRKWDDPKVDARILSGTDASLIGPPISRQLDYARTLANYDWNCNICGFFGSLPFRFADAFALGRGVITDEPVVRWYQPFDLENEVRIMGPLGYERAQSVDWNQAETVLRQARADSDSPSAKERRAYIRSRFDSVWSPIVFARYVVRSCTDPL